MSDEFSNWDMKVAEWRGYTLRALESLNDEIAALRGDIRKIDKKVDRIESKVTGMRIKIATLAGSISVIITLILSMVGYFLK